MLLSLIVFDGKIILQLYLGGNAYKKKKYLILFLNSFNKS